jgi:hypothetical protein
LKNLVTESSTQKKVIRLSTFHGKLCVSKVAVSTERFRNILHNEELIIQGSDALGEMIRKNARFFVGRLGSVEAELVNQYRVSTKKDRHNSLIANLRLRKVAWISAGIWPPTKKQIRFFTKNYIQALKDLTCVATWDHKSLGVEKSILDEFCPDARKIPLGSLDSVLVGYLHGNSWSLELKNLNVLVISMFATEIENQIAQNKPLHSTQILPKFNLYTIKPPQTNGITFTKGTYRKNLERFRLRIASELKLHNIDVVLVSAGAYGLPICETIFKSGRSVIYVGGCLQLMFGILGKRWDGKPEILKMANHNWIRPDKNSKPKGAVLIEGSCYW